MEEFKWKNKIQSFDERRDIIIPGDAEETVLFAVKQFLSIGQNAIQDHGFFAVALSGGSTPCAIFKKLSQDPYREQLDWSKVLCFWSDERSVAPSHPDSNFHMAMESGLSRLPIPKEHLFRMEAELEIEAAAHKYEEIFKYHVPSQQFDLMMLGMGEDGHIASLFPCTHGLHTKDKLIIANYIPQKHTWRMSVTYQCIHNSHIICIYVIGKNKADQVAHILTAPYDPDNLPAQRVGTPNHKALWVLDRNASSKLVDLMVI